jgi:4-amino-4-deoxy-L-arabinose transferase-like glycosyltransferase
MASRRVDLLISLALFAGSALVRFPFRSEHIFHGDSYGLAAGALFTLTAHPPGFIGYGMLVRAAYFFTDDVNLAFVVINALATGMATALTYLLGKAMFSRSVGLIAAAFYGSSLCTSYFSVVALTYAAEGAFATAAGLTGWMSVRQRSFHWLLLHTLVLGFGGSVRQTTLAFLFPLWLWVCWRAVPRWWQRAAAAGVLFVAVAVWSGPNAERLARYWDKEPIGYIQSVYKLQVAMKQYYDSTSFGVVEYESEAARFHWPLAELGVALWNQVVPPSPDAPLEVRTASAAHALRLIRYQTAKLLFYGALAMGLAAPLLALLWLPGVRALLRPDRGVFLALWIVPAAAFFALNHLGAWGYLLIFLSALTVIAAAVLVQLVGPIARRTAIASVIVVANCAVFLWMRPLPDTSDRNRVINVALLQYGAPAIRAHYARARSRAFTADPRQLPLECLTDECLKVSLPRDFRLPADLLPARTLRDR